MYRNVRVLTRYPLASDSVDHRFPRGTKNDASLNYAFNQKMAEVVNSAYARVLDLGCSGGSFVESLVQMGCFAIGIEGSDYSKKLGRAAWSTVPKCLHTADLGHPFLVMNGRRIQAFDVVTAWEVLEHLTEDQLDTLNVTIHAHLDTGGLFIGSVNTNPDFFEGHEYHATVKPEAWWRAWFLERGWAARDDVRDRIHPYWVRGPNTDGHSSVPLVMQR